MRISRKNYFSFGSKTMKKQSDYPRDPKFWPMLTDGRCKEVVDVIKVLHGTTKCCCYRQVVVISGLAV